MAELEMPVMKSTSVTATPGYAQARGVEGGARQRNPVRLSRCGGCREEKDRRQDDNRPRYTTCQRLTYRVP